MESSPGHGFSFLRHVSSLSAGAIVLQVGFLEKVFPHPRWKALIAVSVVAFTLSIIGSVITQWSLLGIMHGEGAREDYKNLGGCGVIGMWVTFIAGLVAAVVFSLKNLFQL